MTLFVKNCLFKFPYFGTFIVLFSEERVGWQAVYMRKKLSHLTKTSGRVLNVTFKPNRRIDSGPSGSRGKYLGLTGDTKLNNRHSPGREFTATQDELWASGNFILHHTLFYMAGNVFIFEMYISINKALNLVYEMFPLSFWDGCKDSIHHWLKKLSTAFLVSHITHHIQGYLCVWLHLYFVYMIMMNLWCSVASILYSDLCQILMFGKHLQCMMSNVY